MKFILALSFFLLSLTSHTTFVYIPALALLIIYSILSRSLFPITKNNLLSFFAFFVFIFSSALYFKTLSDNISDASEASFYNNLLFSFILFFCVLILAKIFNNKNCHNDASFAIKFILLVHASVFIVQFVVVYSTGEYIDLIKPVTGEDSRYLNYIMSGSMSDMLLYRVTGMYIEPSTYASAMTCMIMAGVAMGVNRKIILFSLLTLLLNFSTIGVILFAMVTASIFIRNINMRFIIASLLVVSFLVAINYEIIFKFIDDFMFKFSVTSGSRFKLMEYIYLDHGLIRVLGSGFFNIPKDLLAEISSGDYTIAAINDAGLFSFLVLRFGILVVAPVIYVFSKMRDIRLKFLLICILISKMSFLFPIIYIPIIAAWKRKNSIEGKL
ncbi:hypothetical protein ACRWUA_14625 [Escherichia coli]